MPKESIEVKSIAVVIEDTRSYCFECTSNCPVDTIEEAI